jgi:hypothetical protein
MGSKGENNSSLHLFDYLYCHSILPKKQIEKTVLYNIQHNQ